GWNEAQTLELEGKTEPVTAFAVVGAGRVSVVPRGLEGVQAQLIERGAELAHGAEVLENVAAGIGGVLVVTGEPGIGKSRLLAELRASFESMDAARGTPVWLEGRCVSYGEAMPYWPFRDLLRAWLGVLADEPELRVRVTLRRQIGRLFGERAIEYYPYLGAMLGLTLEPEAHARLAELSGDGGRDLLRSLIGGIELAPAMERRILEPAEGNPFFLEEIVRSLVDAGALVHDRDGWRFDHEVDVEVPPTVEKVIVARIDRLGPPARDALLAAA